MKLFGKKETDTHIIYYFFGFKLKFKVKVKKNLTKEEFELFLNKYKYILNKKFNTEDKKFEKSNYIWQLWLQGTENAPDIVKKCMESVEYFCPNKNIIHLDENNISKYITIPNYIQTKYENGIISPAHYSDFIRLELLSKYGGLWLDSTVLLTDKIPKELFTSGLFLFKEFGWDSTYDKCTKTSLLLLLSLLRFLKPDLKKPSISNWFIYSTPNNLIIQSTKNFIKDYWEKENCLRNYFLFHYWVRYAVIHNNGMNQLFENIYSIPNSFPHYMQATWCDKFDSDLFKEICSYSPIHKLTYKNLEHCNKEYLDNILNLNFKNFENSFTKSNWGL